jgi:hypothetical protein
MVRGSSKPGGSRGIVRPRASSAGIGVYGGVSDEYSGDEWIGEYVGEGDWRGVTDIPGEATP